MRLRVMLAAVGGAVVVGVGAAIAARAPEIDPATVPTGGGSLCTSVASLSQRKEWTMAMVVVLLPASETEPTQLAAVSKPLRLPSARPFAGGEGS